MILQKIQNFFLENKKSLLYIAGIFMLSFLFSDFTFAADKSEAESVQDIMKLIEGFLVGISMILALMTYLVTLFLDPGWINGTIFDLDIYFKRIWILISNVVYFIFAFLLIWIAFMNIIGKGDEKYQLKQVLPKFIVGVLIVPFSWFIVQFVLSISAVLTVTALSIPFDTFKDFKAITTEIKIPKECTIDLAGIGKAAQSDKPGAINDVLDCGKKADKVSLSDALNSDQFSNNIFGLVSTYTFGVISFDAVNDLTSESLKEVSTWADLIVKVVIDLLFILIYAILILALGLVLFVRGTYLWIYTMLSPIFGLMYFFDKKEGGGDGFFGKFSVSEFLKLALVPVYSMAALSFGLLFLFVVGNGFAGGSAENKNHILKTGDNGDTTYIIGSEGGDDQFKLLVKGSIGNDSENSFLGSLTSGGESKTGGKLGVIGNLVMQVFGVIILWGTVMAALQSSKVTEAVVKPLADFGNQVGQLAAKSPGYLPVFGGQSMTSLNTAASTVAGGIDQKARTAGSEFASNKFGHMYEGSNTKELQTAINKLNSSVSGGNQSAIASNIKGVMSKGADTIANDERSRKDLSKAVGKLTGYSGLTNSAIEEFQKSIATASNEVGVKTAFAMLDSKMSNDGTSLIADSTTPTVSGNKALDKSFTKEANITSTPKSETNTLKQQIDIYYDNDGELKSREIKKIAKGFKDEFNNKDFKKSEIIGKLTKLGVNEGDDIKIKDELEKDSDWLKLID